MENIMTTSLKPLVISSNKNVKYHSQLRVSSPCELCVNFK